MYDDEYYYGGWDDCENDPFINSSDYDGLDFEDRCDRISSDLAGLGLSFSNAFNSDNIFSEERSLRVECPRPQITEVFLGKNPEDASLSIRGRLLRASFNVRFDENDNIIAKMDYIQDSYSSHVRIADIHFYQLDVCNRITLDILADFADGECLFKCYPDISSAIGAVNIWVHEHQTDPKWQLIRWQTMKTFSLPYCDSMCTYVVRAIVVNGLIYDAIMANAGGIDNPCIRNVTKFVTMHAEKVDTLKELLNTRGMQITMQSLYEMLLQGIDVCDAQDTLGRFVRLSYELKFSQGIIAFIEKYWYMAIREYDSSINADGYRVRVYVDNCTKICAYAVVYEDRIVYHTDNIGIRMNSVIPTDDDLYGALALLHDPILMMVFGNDIPHWETVARSELYECIFRQMGTDVKWHRTIKFRDGIHSLEIAKSGGLRIFMAALTGEPNPLNVRSFIMKLINNSGVVTSTLSEPAFQDAIINYAKSDCQSMENPICYFKASPSTVDEFNNMIRDCEFFEYGEDAVCSNEYKLRLYYNRHDTVIGVSMIGSDMEILYCQRFFGPSIHRDVLYPKISCWKDFLHDLEIGHGSRRTTSAFRSVARIFNSDKWTVDNLYNAIEDIPKVDKQPEPTYSRYKRIKEGLYLSDLPGEYMKLKVISRGHEYTVKIRVTWSDRKDAPMIKVVDVYVGNDYGIRFLELPKSTFTDIDSLCQLIKRKLDPIVDGMADF